MKSFVAAVVAVLVWLLIWDHVIVGMVLGPTLSQIPGMVAEPSRLWEGVGDLFAAIMFVGVYARTRSVWGVGAKQGAIYGVYAGLLIHFPTWLFMSVYAGWPYAAAWTITAALVAVSVVAGVLAGMVYEMTGGAKPA